MQFVAVLVAAVAAFAWGAVWYMMMAKPWMAASGVTEEQANTASPMIYGGAFISTVIVAGMMRHMFMMGGIDTLDKGLIGGFGIGLFIVVPWMTTHYLFSFRPRNLILIDGAYSTIGCTIIGIVLTLF